MFIVSVFFIVSVLFKCSLKKSITPKIRILCFVIINCVLFNLLCIWIVFKTVSRQVFPLSELRYTVDIYTRKLFFSAHIKLNIDYASIVWNGCSEVLKKRLNALQRRAVKLMIPGTVLTTYHNLKVMRIMNLHK